MARKEKSQPATRDKTCKVCGVEYTYPTPQSAATRVSCELCAGLTSHTRDVLLRMSKRISSLERKITNLKKGSKPLDKY